MVAVKTPDIIRKHRERTALICLIAFLVIIVPIIGRVHDATYGVQGDAVFDSYAFGSFENLTDGLAIYTTINSIETSQYSYTLKISPIPIGSYSKFPIDGGATRIANVSGYITVGGKPIKFEAGPMPLEEVTLTLEGSISPYPYDVCTLSRL